MRYYILVCRYLGVCVVHICIFIDVAFMRFTSIAIPYRIYRCIRIMYQCVCVYVCAYVRGTGDRSTSNTGMSDRLENVTQTISRILEGYDIRLRPNFGGMINLSTIPYIPTCFVSNVVSRSTMSWTAVMGRNLINAKSGVSFVSSSSASHDYTAVDFGLHRFVWPTLSTVTSQTNHGWPVITVQRLPI